MKTQYSKIGSARFYGSIVINLVLCLYMMMKYFYFKDTKPVELGNVSDWVSSVCNIVMAGAAIYAAISVKDWISDNVNNKGFKHAELIIDEIGMYNTEAETIKNNCLGMIYAIRTGSFDVRNYIPDVFEVHERLIENQNRYSSILSKIDTMKHWDIKLIKHGFFDDYLTSKGHVAMQCKHTLAEIMKSKTHLVPPTEIITSLNDKANQEFSKIILPFKSIFESLKKQKEGWNDR